MEINQSLEEIQNFKGKYPKQLWYLFFSEMWERFSFYGMRGMLVIFMVSHLDMDEKQLIYNMVQPKLGYMPLHLLADYLRIKF